MHAQRYLKREQKRNRKPFFLFRIGIRYIRNGYSLPVQLRNRKILEVSQSTSCIVNGEITSW
jgi:hypothetical protein